MSEPVSVSAPTLGGAGGKSDRVIRAVVHSIATGKWLPGQRLPSVRESESIWGVNRLTVLKAYRSLVAAGLVRSAPRSGFFVSAGPRVERATRHRVELERICDSICAQIRRQTGLSPVGALRYMAQLAESRAQECPECAFVECTRFQAASHAAEIASHLAVPCLPLTLEQLAGKRLRIPPHVRTLITTGFHRAEVGALAEPPDLVAVEVPIRFSPRTAADLGRSGAPVVALGLDRETMIQIAGELVELIDLPDDALTTAQVTPDELDDTLRQYLGDADSRTGALDRPRVLLSTSLWEAAAHWHDHPSVQPIDYELCPEAWPRLADAIGLPLGSLP